MVICLEQGADLHMAQLMPLPLTVSCFTKIQVGFTFLVPAHLGSPGQRAAKWVCVCYRLILERVKLLTWTATSTTQVGTVSCNIVCSASPPASLHSSRYWVLPPTSLHTYIHTQSPHLTADIQTHRHRTSLQTYTHTDRHYKHSSTLNRHSSLSSRVVSASVCGVRGSRFESHR